MCQRNKCQNNNEKNKKWQPGFQESTCTETELFIQYFKKLVKPKYTKKLYINKIMVRKLMKNRRTVSKTYVLETYKQKFH